MSNIVRMAGAALASSALGAPNVISISDDYSNAINGKTAGVRISNNGYYYKYRGGVANAEYVWITPQSNYSEYEVKATLNSGDTPAGDSLATWLSLSTSRDWTLQNGTIEGESTCSLTLEIRWTGNNVVQDSATYSITANGPAA